MQILQMEWRVLEILQMERRVLQILMQMERRVLQILQMGSIPACVGQGRRGQLQ